jgi:hypothetical protein
MPSLARRIHDRWTATDDAFTHEHRRIVLRGRYPSEAAAGLATGTWNRRGRLVLRLLRFAGVLP